MTKITLKKTNSTYYEILKGEIKVGGIIFNDEYEDNRVYLENIEVNADSRNQGIGTEAMKIFAELNSDRGIYFAPDNEDAKRLYDRIAEEMSTSEYNEYGGNMDQGYGIYIM